MLNLFRIFRKDKILFDIVIVFGYKVERCFDIVAGVDRALRYVTWQPYCGLSILTCDSSTAAASGPLICDKHRQSYSSSNPVSTGMHDRSPIYRICIQLATPANSFPILSRIGNE